MLQKCELIAYSEQDTLTLIAMTLVYLIGQLKYFVLRDAGEKESLYLCLVGHPDWVPATKN